MQLQKYQENIYANNAYEPASMEACIYRVPCRETTTPQYPPPAAALCCLAVG